MILPWIQWFLLSLLLGFSLAEPAKLDTIFPVDLDASNFEHTLLNLPATYAGALVEFYAHWCPHCQKFEPRYKEVADFFHAEPHVKPDILVARIDCAKHVRAIWA